MNSEIIREMIEYYRTQGAPQDQQMLIALLREAQEADDGLLLQNTMEAIAKAYGLKSTMLQALVRLVPDLRMESAAHRLEVCGTCRAGAKLREDIERIYGVRSGGCSEKGGFVYRVTPCMKNCRNGPSIRWDGRLHSHADMKLIQALINGNG